MIWYPYTQMKTMEDPVLVTDAHGAILETPEGPLIDSIASWWSMAYGYKHPELTKVLTEQANCFSHVMLGGLTHEPVQKLTEKLESWLPGDLNHCFYSDSGSVAIEVALKMALQYDIKCPRCRVRDMKLVGRCLSSRDLGLYKCRICDQD